MMAIAMHKSSLTILAGLAALLVALMPSSAAQVEMLPVAAVTIYPGDLISEAMIEDGRFPAGTSRNRMIVATREELVGKTARRTLLPGRIIAQNAIGERDLVSRGSIVPAVYVSGTLVITASVVALQSGALGSVIQVRNVDSGKVIVGQVDPDGSVRVSGK